MSSARTGTGLHDVIGANGRHTMSWIRWRGVQRREEESHYFVSWAREQEVSLMEMVSIRGVTCHVGRHCRPDV